MVKTDYRIYKNSLTKLVQIRVAAVFIPYFFHSTPSTLTRYTNTFISYQATPNVPLHSSDPSLVYRYRQKIFIQENTF